MPESEAVTMQRTPATKPMPATTPPPATLRSRSGVSEAEAGERRELEERRVGVEQQREALARQQLAALLEARAGRGRCRRGPRLAARAPVEQVEHRGAVLREGGTADVECRGDERHAEAGGPAILTNRAHRAENKGAGRCRSGRRAASSQRPRSSGRLPKGTSMQYMILIYGDERNFAALANDPEAQKQMYAAYTRYGADMREAGVLRGGCRAEAEPQRDHGAHQERQAGDDRLARSPRPRSSSAGTT
jgi:hypothetical protein